MLARYFIASLLSITIAGTIFSAPGASAETRKESKSSSKTSSKTAIGDLASKLQSANKSFWQGDYNNAREVLNAIVSSHKDSSDDVHGYTRILINLGLLNLVQENPERASDLFNEAKERIKKQEESDEVNLADCMVGLAESHYLNGHPEDAIEMYKKALEIYNKKYSEFSPDLLPALEGIAGSYYASKQYKKALPYYRKIAQIDLIKYGAEHERVGMSFNNLSDVFYKLKQCSGARPFFSQSVWIFRKNNLDRILAEYDTKKARKKYSKDELTRIRRRIKEVVMGMEDPPEFRKASFKLLEDKSFNESCPICEEERPNDFNNWRLKRSAVSKPGMFYIDPTVEPKAIIICLHGLGLNHTSYKEFASKVTPEGFSVIAIDVRGFGSLSHEKGFDKVDLEAAIEDLSALVSIIRYNNQNLPLFVLGESMGGALALQFTAMHEDMVDGLISSVPSGRRFKSKRTKFLVGIKLLNDPKKPFEIGRRVIDQATENSKLKEAWKKDPANRLKLSPEELLHFESFMKHNEKFARKITDTPVIVFQGFQDHLVRPTGTYMLYQALGTSEKDLVFVGDKEHLVFEEGQASDEIVSMLVAWLRSHMADKAKNKCESEKASKESQNKKITLEESK